MILRVPAVLALLTSFALSLAFGAAARAAVAESAASARLEVAPQPAAPLGRIWEGAGVLVGDATGFQSDRAPTLRRSGFSWVALKIHHGLGRVRENEAVLARGWARAFRGEGIRVCGWGAVEQHPVREARLVSVLVRRFALDCYIADAENAYMGVGYGGVVARSDVFVRAFRTRLARVPAAVTTYGAAIHPWILPFDYGAWRDGGFALLPQAYLSISSHYGPKLVVEHAVRAGYPPQRVHPLIGIGWTQGRRKHWGGDYVWRLRAAGTRGFSVFLGETTSDHDFHILGRGIARYGIARR